jgi:hypothetical protein
MKAPIKDEEGNIVGSPFLNDDYTVNLQSGGSFDWGRDMGARLQNQGQNIDLGSERNPFDVDFSDPRAQAAAAAMDPLGSIMSGFDQSKYAIPVAGYAVNTILSSGDPVANAREMYARAGLDYGTARQMIEQSDKIEQERKDAYYNTLDQVFEVNAYDPKKPAAENQIRQGLMGLGSLATLDPRASATVAPDKKKGLLGLGAVTSGG